MKTAVVTDSTAPDRLTPIKQRQQRQDAVAAQIYGRLLLPNGKRVTAQLEANTETIAALRAILRDRYSNSHSGDRP